MTFFFILGAIDSNHIPIIAPSHDSIIYYNKKMFYSYLLQRVVDADYDFGWSGRIHIWAMF